MDHKTRQALEGSIRKWEQIVQGSESDLGGQNCPLCAEFADKSGEDAEGNEIGGCFGCPVRKATGWDQCQHTPYSAWARATPWRGEKIGRRVEHEAQRWLARAELEFLRSLRPSETEAEP